MKQVRAYIENIENCEHFVFLPSNIYKFSAIDIAKSFFFHNNIAPRIPAPMIIKQGSVFVKAITAKLIVLFLLAGLYSRPIAKKSECYLVLTFFEVL